MESTVKADPTYMMAFFRIGQLAAVANSNHGRGEEALKKYLAHQPGSDEAPHARTWFWLGGIYETSGRKAEARSALPAVAPDRARRQGSYRGLETGLVGLAAAHVR